MNWLKYVIIFLFFVVFSLLQVSFFPYFSIFGATPNLVFALFFTLLFFEPQAVSPQSFFTIIAAGLLIDIFLPLYFGPATVTFLLIYLFCKLVMHIFAQGRESHLIFYYLCLFSVSFLGYNILLYATSLLFNFEFSAGVITAISLLYSLPFAALGFYAGRKIFFHGNDNQLKLL